MLLPRILLVLLLVLLVVGLARVARFDVAPPQALPVEVVADSSLVSLLRAQLEEEMAKHELTRMQLSLATIRSQESAAPGAGTVITNPHYRKEEDFFHFCIDNCGMQGIASHVLVKSMYFNLSLELGFKLHFMNHLFDFVQEKDKDLYLQPVFPGASFYPPRCDFVLGGNHHWKFNCIRERHLWSNFFHSYHTWVYSLYSQTYSIKLRSLARLVSQELLKRFGGESEVEFIGMHSRLDYQYLKDKMDDRRKRNITWEEVGVMQQHLQGKIRAPRFHYLIVGDTSTALLDHAENGTNLFLEEYLERTRPALTKLQRMFVALDVMSRLCRVRMLSKFGSNFPVHMAFHRLNHNMDGLIIGDLFTMRTYDYFGRELEVVSPAFDPVVYFRNEPYNPYTFTSNNFSQLFAIKCFREMLFDKQRVELNLNPRNYTCTAKEFARGEVGGKYWYQTDYF